MGEMAMEQMQHMLDGVDDRTFVFGSLFVTANLLETMLDRAFAPYGITVKQWMLLITITSLFAEPPTVKQVAGAMGTSHQNVKQVALNLEKRGFLRLVKDAKDARVTRLVTTEACRTFSEETSQAGELFMQTAFAGIRAEDLAGARKTLLTLWQNALEMKHPIESNQ
jgi:DNA-binding MarR family transcriptional regulator